MSLICLFLLCCFAGLSTDVEHFLSCGADRVLLKPLDIDAFGAAMRELSLTSMYRAQGLRHFTSD